MNKKKMAILSIISLFIFNIISIVLGKSNIYLGIALIFCILYLIGIVFKRTVIKNKFGAFWLLAYAYLLIFIPILLSYFKIIKSNEFLFLFFIFFSVIAYELEIDPRYSIVMALLMLWLAPFLMSFGMSALAEETAIIVYYFLICALALQVIQFRQNSKINIDLDKIKLIFIRKNNLYYAVFWLIFYFIAGYFLLSPISLALSLYFSTVFGFFYGARLLLKHDTKKSIWKGLDTY
ncbi:MAG: hypothetical protein V1859_10925 [archaeon]